MTTGSRATTGRPLPGVPKKFKPLVRGTVCRLSFHVPKMGAKRGHFGGGLWRAQSGDIMLSVGCRCNSLSLFVIEKPTSHKRSYVKWHPSKTHDVAPGRASLFGGVKWPPSTRTRNPRAPLRGAYCVVPSGATRGWWQCPARSAGTARGSAAIGREFENRGAVTA